MLFPAWLSHVSRACTALSKHRVGVEAPFWPDFWDRGRACARGGGVERFETCLRPRCPTNALCNEHLCGVWGDSQVSHLSPIAYTVAALLRPLTRCVECHSACLVLQLEDSRYVCDRHL